jgi:hypothetical protein
LPAVDKYKPEYYRLDTLSCGRGVSASVLRDERQISSVAPKSLSSSSYKELKNEEALAKDTMSVLSSCELALYGISESLQHSNFELPEETTQLCSSHHVGLIHAIALSCKASPYALKRRDSVIAESKLVIRLPQLTAALRSAPLGESFLFQDSLEEAIKIQKNLDPITTKRASWPRPPPRYSLPTQVGTSREATLGQNLEEMLLGTMVLVGGQRGHKRSYSTSKSKGTSDQASSSSYPSKRGKKSGGNRK